MTGNILIDRNALGGDGREYRKTTKYMSSWKQEKESKVVGYNFYLKKMPKT